MYMMMLECAKLEVMTVVMVLAPKTCFPVRFPQSFRGYNTLIPIDSTKLLIKAPQIALNAC